MNNKIKNNLLIILALVVIGIIVTLTVMSNRKGTYSIETDNPKLELTCPETAIPGDTIACVVQLTNNNSTILSVNANYNLNNIITYNNFDANDTCDSNNCFMKFANTENGFSVINKAGTTTNNSIVGSIALNVSDDAQKNTTYKVGLTNIELCDDQYEMINLDNVEVEIRIKNNDADLSDISLDEAELDSNFDNNNNKYTSTVASNTTTANINVTTSDDNATVSGLTENLSLHYGTNTYSITVTAEDGKTTKTYTIEIYRQYDFTTDSYIYDEEDNYIYIGANDINTFYNNLEVLPENLSYSVNNNKLEIKYNNDEVLKSITIVNFISKYTVLEKEIYINENITLEELKNNITSETATFKVIDNNDNEINNNNTVIQSDNTIDIYYNGTKIESYNIKIEYLSFDESLVIDDTKKIIKRISLKSTYGDIKSKISTSGTINLITDATVTDNYELRTGDKISVVINDKTVTYTLSVVGCLDDEIDVSLVDIIKLYRYLKKRITLEEEYVYAADISNDGSVGLDDVIIIYRYYKGRLNSLEVGE